MIIPLKSLWKIDENPKDQLTSIQIVADSQNLVGFVKTELESQLNNYRSSQFSGVQAKPAGFTTSQQSLDTVSSVLTGFQVFLSLVAVISLLVGGIGVLNVMLMSVSQRIREIGIRKALGAKNSDILILFLSESITLTAISGLFGAMLAQYFAYLGVQLLARNGTVLTFEYSWSSVYLAFLLSAVLGTLFGLYPALKASRLSVVDALRFD